MKPLMTSYQTEEVWIPPNDPFVTYERKDESWCRYFGIGHTEIRPARLYDVRYRNLKLAGYLRIYPSEDLRGISVPVKRDTLERHSWEVRSSIEQIVIARERLILLDRYGRQEFTCWTVGSTLDAETLIAAGYMITPSEDNLRRFEKDLFSRQREKVGY